MSRGRWVIVFLDTKTRVERTFILLNFFVGNRCSEELLSAGRPHHPLMVSPGSPGLGNEVMRGLVAVYSRALRLGEYVMVG